jgi:predicted permease
MRSFTRLRAADAGFQPSGLLTFRLPLAGGRNTAMDRRIAFFQEVMDRIGALPGVRSAGAISSLPLTGLWDGAPFWVEGRPSPPPDQRPIGLVRAVTPGYFATLGIPLVAGRLFTAGDTAQSPLMLIVNQTLARRFWPQGNPVGGRLILANGRAAEIVGVVGDVKQDKIEGEEWPTVYGPYPQLPYLTMVVAVRSAGPPAGSLASALQREVHRIDPDQPLTDVRPMESIVTRAVAGAKFNTVVLGIFAVIAFVLAAVGIYGVIACDVSERTHEIGIRVALGAQSGDVLKLVVGQGARLAAYGIAAGLAGAFALTRLMTTILYGVKATDGVTFAMISLLLAGVALAASYLPSRRAMALDPVVALRHE